MRFTNDPISNCIPEYYRNQREKRDHQCDLTMQSQARYLAHRQIAITFQ